MVEPRGIEPQSGTASESSDSTQNHAKFQQNNALRPAADEDEEQKDALRQQNLNISERQKCATCVQQDLPTDLASVVAAWDGLPVKLKALIEALVKTTEQ